MNDEQIDRLVIVMLNAGRDVVLETGGADPAELHGTAEAAWAEMAEEEKAAARKFVRTMADAVLAEVGVTVKS